jgi:hypothetical protein
MKKMEFSVRCVRQCLLREQMVYTVRGYDMSNDYVWVDDIGRCFRRQVCVVENKQDLQRFVTLSGFATVDDWWRAIQGFCAGRRKWLYYVLIRNRVGE